jgi:superfamily II DNA or RNA helicase
MKFNDLFKQSKVTRQELSEAISNEDSPHFLLDCPPRTGKSLIFTDLVKNKGWEGNILILSAATSTNNQWLENLEKYNPELLERTDVFCYQSLHKIDKTKYSIIGLDEFELSRSDKRFLQILDFECEHWVGMSGTLDREDIQEFRELTKNQFFHAKISLEQGVEWGILPEPKIYACKLRLDNEKRYLVYHASKNKKLKNEVVTFPQRWESIKNKKVNTLIQCTEQEYHELICYEFNKWKSYEEEFNLPVEERSDTIRFLMKQGFSQTICRDKKMRVGLERKKFFATIKNRWFKRIFSELPKNSRCLVFCNDITQADLLNSEFAVHSKSENDLSLVDRFNSGEINQIFSIGMVERGVDFERVDYLIIIQSSGSQVSQLQKTGRSYLSVAPKIIVMYYPNTQDQKYVDEFLKQFKPEWIIHKTL